MAERDVIVRLGVKPIPGGDGGLKQIGMAAKTASQATTELKTATDNYLQSLQKEKAYINAVSQDRRIQNALIEKEIALKRQSNQLDALRVQAGLKVQPGFFGKGGGGEGLGLASVGRAAPIVGAFALAIQIATAAMRAWKDQLVSTDPTILSTNERTGVYLAQDAPFLFGHNAEATRVRERRLELGQAAVRNQSLEAQLGIRSRGRAEQAGLAQQLAAARLGVGQGGTDIEQLEARRNAAAFAGITAGKDQLRLQQELAEAQHERLTAAQNLSREGATEFDKAKARLNIDAALVRESSALKDLQEAQNRGLDAARDKSALLLELGQKRVDKLTQERDKVAEIAKTERERLQGAKEQFGLLDPLKRRAAVDIARRVAGGGDVSKEELDFAKGLDVFKDALGRRGAAQAGPEFDQIVRLLGADRKVREAEAKEVKLTNQIQVQIQLNEKALTEQIQREVIPRILEAMQRSAAQLANEFAKANNQAAAASRAAAQQALAN